MLVWQGKAVVFLPDTDGHFFVVWPVADSRVVGGCSFGSQYLDHNIMS